MKTMKRGLSRRGVLAGSAAFLGSTMASPGLGQASSYPDRPVRLVVPFPPGGNVDSVSRLISARLRDELGVPVVIQNMGGASGIIGTENVARAPADGYTILMVGSNHGINPAVFARLPYDTLNDFAPVGLVGTIPLVLTVPAQMQALSVSDLVAASRANRDAVRFGITPSSMTHLATEMLVRRTGMQAIQVPYRGDGPTIVDLLGGQVTAYVGIAGLVLPHIRDGRLRPLAVTTPRRVQFLPDVPTMQEQGLAGYEASSWNGLLAPAGTPAGVIGRLHSSFMATLADPAVRSSLEGLGMTVLAGSPETLADFVRNEVRRWTGVVEEAGIERI